MKSASPIILGLLLSYSIVFIVVMVFIVKLIKNSDEES